MRGFRLFCFMIVLCPAFVSAASAQQVLTMPSGQKLAVNGVKAIEQPGSGKTIRAAVSLPGGETKTREQLSMIADEFFLFYFGVYAEKESYASAAIWFPKDVKAGPLSFTSAEAFNYKREDKGLWKPEHDSLMDDRPIPEPTALDLPSGKQIFVEFAGLTHIHQLRREGWGSDYWSEISFETDPQTVYAQTREYWNYVKDKVDPSIGIAAIFAFDQPIRGFFHFRKHMYVFIRAIDGKWAELPETLEEAMGQKSKLIQANFGPQLPKTVWPKR